MRRLTRIVALVMIVAGLGMLAWAVTVWQWQDPFTAVVQELEQRKLSKNFEREVALAKRKLPRRIEPAPDKLGPQVSRDAKAWRLASQEGDAIAHLRIPAIGVDEIVVNGTQTDTLKRGPGRYLGSAMPGEGELVYIAGHRTTYGAPFSRIDHLAKGDTVFLELPYGTFKYVITGHRIVPADKLSELRSRGFEQLSLQACHPRFFATERYIAYGKPVSITRPGETRPSPFTPETY